MKRLLSIIFVGLLTFGSFVTGSEAKTTTGWASFYKSGKRTASGEHFNPNGLTAAHRNRPFGPKVLVTNLNNGRSVMVRINEGGTFTRGRGWE